MNGELFPCWQPDRREYGLVCVYLGVPPDEGIFRRLTGHLATAPFTGTRPRGLAAWLAQRPLTAFRLARLDLASRLFFPDHPVRHLLNAAVALHECHGPGYRALDRPPAGRAATWASIGAELLRFAGGLALTLPWLAVQAVRWLAGTALAPEPALAGRRVLVTGVGRGLGLDLMLECLEQGARVVGTVRTPEAARALAAQLPAAAPLSLVVADLASPGALPRALDAAGVRPDELDLVVQCAGTKHDGTSVLAVDAVRDTLQVNFLAGVELAAWLLGGAAEAAAAPAARRAAPALAVVSSIGRWHGMHSTAGYNASKAALSIWAESLEMDQALRGRGLRVTVVEPGLFESGMVRRSGALALLFAPRRQVARRILGAAAARRRVVRPPGWFALLTWALCIAGRGVRLRVFARARRGGAA